MSVVCVPLNWYIASGFGAVLQLLSATAAVNVHIPAGQQPVLSVGGVAAGSGTNDPEVVSVAVQSRSFDIIGASPDVHPIDKRNAAPASRIREPSTATAMPHDKAGVFILPDLDEVGGAWGVRTSPHIAISRGCTWITNCKQ